MSVQITPAIDGLVYMHGSSNQAYLVWADTRFAFVFKQGYYFVFQFFMMPPPICATYYGSMDAALKMKLTNGNSLKFEVS